jgi:hypothetical protein
MASFHSFLVVLVLHLCSLASAAPWIVTTYFEEATHTKPAGSEATTSRDDSMPTGVWIDPTVDDPAAIQTWTSVLDDVDITFVNVLVEPSQGRPHTESHASGDYYVQVTEPWPSSCPESTGTLTTEVAVYVPWDVRSALTPTSTGQNTLNPTTTRMKLYLDPTDVPADVLSTAISGIFYCDSTYGYGDDYDYDLSCVEYGYFVFGNEIGVEECCSDGCHQKWGLQFWSLAVVIVASWFGFFLILGIAASVYRFKKLMVGDRSKRGLPGVFACLLPLLSCLLLFFSRHGYQARPPEEQAELRKKWDAMSFGTKTALWFRWGFSSKYPPMLGTPPPRYSSRNGKDTNTSTSGAAAAQERNMEHEPAPPAYGSADVELSQVYQPTDTSVAQPKPTGAT